MASKLVATPFLLGRLLLLTLILGMANPLSAQTLQVIHDFVSIGSFPYGRLMQGSDGFLYGTTAGGGGAQQGTVFKIASDGSNFTQLKNFNCDKDNEGCGPRSGLIEGSDGFLYGTTAGGGVVDRGTIFKIAKDGSGFESGSFSGTELDGNTPRAGLIEGSDGFLYGTTAGPGAGIEGGTLFRISKDGTSFLLLKAFRCGDHADGCLASAGLIEGSDGALYGTTERGGLFNRGTVFTIAKDGTGFQLLRSFQCGASDGCTPTAELIEGTDRLLYGTTSGGGASGGGTVFRLAKDGSGFTLLKEFQCYGGTNSCVLGGGLLEGSDGFLYGTTNQGGTNSQGTVFRIARDGSNFTTLRSLDCAQDGCNPGVGLTEGDDGLLYGVAFNGGLSGHGSLFKIAKDGSGFDVLAPAGCLITNGCAPMAELIQASDGFLYGTTMGGGEFNQGTVFRVGTDGTGFRSLQSFKCGATEGCYPSTKLIEGSDGLLYGTTGDSSLGGGTVFRIAKDGSGFSLLRSFHCGNNDGCLPDAGLSEGSDGFLYGTTRTGGLFYEGTVFRMARDGTGFALLKSFQCRVSTNGCYPYAELIEASDGFLYGTTGGGGASGGGTVFKIAKDGTAFTLLKSFECRVSTEVCQPNARLIEGSDGFLYGTASEDYIANFGAVFKIAKDGTGFMMLKRFPCTATDGCSTAGGVVEGPDGLLYGTTRWRTDYNPSIVFKIAKDGFAYNIIHRFDCNGEDGCWPQAGLTKASDGFLYGTTSAGGLYGSGTVYRILLGDTPPNPIVDLSVQSATQSSVALKYTAPGDNGNTGTAKSYDLRFSTTLLGNSNWESATQVNSEPSPLPAGSAENFTVTGLLCGKIYYFGVTTLDSLNVASELSNIVEARTTACNKLRASSTSLPTAEVNVSYNSGPFNIAGGVAPYTVQIDPATLPPGLASSSQAISGTPTNAGTASFTGLVSDAVGSVAKVKFKLKIVRAVMIATTSLKAGKANAKYNATLKAKDGINGYAWSVDPATPLPGTLVLDGSTGRIAGVVNVATSTDIKFIVTDAVGATAFKTLRLTFK